MEPKIFHKDSSEEYYAPERCYIIELSNLESDGDVSIARARVLPGVTTARHILDGINERYIITAGKGNMEVGEMPPKEVLPGEVVTIPAGVAQRITNIGQTDLIFYCVCTPHFRRERYRDVDQG